MKVRFAAAIGLAGAVAVLGSCSSSASGGAPPDGGTPPDVPVVFGIAGVSSSQIWMNIGGGGQTLAGYRVFRDGAYVRLVQTTTSIYFNDTGLTPNTTYCYQVSAVGATGNESERCSELCATTLQASGTDPCAANAQCSDCLTGHYGVCGFCWRTGLCQTGTSSGPSPSVGVCPSSWTFAPGGHPYTSCSSSHPACDACLHSCQGVSGCCTGCGCICQDECGGIC